MKGKKTGGRQQKFGEQTIRVSFRLPQSKKAEIVTEINKLLEPYQTKKP